MVDFLFSVSNKGDNFCGFLFEFLYNSDLLIKRCSLKANNLLKTLSNFFLLAFEKAFRLNAFSKASKNNFDSVVSLEIVSFLINPFSPGIQTGYLCVSS